MTPLTQTELALTAAMFLAFLVFVCAGIGKALL